MVNPGQDGDPDTDPTRNLNHRLARLKDDRQAEIDEIRAIEQEGGFRTLKDGSQIRMVDESGKMYSMNMV